MQNRSNRLIAGAAALFLAGVAIAILFPSARVTLLYAFQTLLTIIGLARLRTVHWPKKVFWAGFLAFIGLGDLAYWFFQYSPWATLKSPYLYFFTGMSFYLLGTTSGILFLLLSGSVRRAGSVRTHLIDHLPSILVLAISCKFVAIPIAMKVIAQGIDISLLGAVLYFSLSVAAVIVCLRVLLVEEEARLVACSMGLVIQSLVSWGINIEYMVTNSYQFSFFDIVWFSSILSSILPVLLWPEGPRAPRAIRTGEELNYQVRYWLLLLVLVPLTVLSFLQAFNPKAVSVVSMAILGGIGFVWIASIVLIDRIRSSAELKALSATAQIASQVAHDIRSPLAALEVLLKRSGALHEDDRNLMDMAVTRVRDIADGMLRKNREAVERTREIDLHFIGEFTPSNEPIEEVSLKHALQSMLAEKRLEYMKLPGVRFQETIRKDAELSIASIQPRELKRLLSNLINNSVESLASKEGTVEVVLAAQNGSPVIEIRDDGKGIDPENLKVLGRRGRSFGKVQGSGLGLFHALQTMRFWDGRLEVDSTIGRGTTVTLTFRSTPR